MTATMKTRIWWRPQTTLLPGTARTINGTSRRYIRRTRSTIIPRETQGCGRSLSRRFGAWDGMPSKTSTCRPASHRPKNQRGQRHRRAPWSRTPRATSRRGSRTAPVVRRGARLQRRARRRRRSGRTARVARRGAPLVRRRAGPLRLRRSSKSRRMTTTTRMLYRRRRGGAGRASIPFRCRTLNLARLVSLGGRSGRAAVPSGRGTRCLVARSDFGMESLAAHSA